MDFRLLGPLEVVTGQRVIGLGPPRQRALLAVLLIRRNEIVPLDVISSALWPDDPPRTAAQIVRVYVSQLRKLLGDDDARRLLVTHSNGYALQTAADEVDADRFESLCEEARDLLSADDPESARVRLDEALLLWRGDPLPEFVYDDFAAPEIRRLTELRLAAFEDRFDAALATGHAGDLVADLERLARENPLRERLHAQLMLALYRADRQADALATYQDVRRRLVDELGLEPGETLRALHTRMLQRDPELARARAWPLPSRLSDARRRPGGFVAAALLLVLAIAAADRRVHDLARRLRRIGAVCPSAPGHPREPGSSAGEQPEHRRVRPNRWPSRRRTRPGRHDDHPVGWAIRTSRSDLGPRDPRRDAVPGGLRRDPTSCASVSEEAFRRSGGDLARARLHRSPQRHGFAFDDRELGYLAGYLAALMVRPHQTISAVGGVPVPPVRDLIAGYTAGAAGARPSVRVIVDYSYTFVDQRRCERLAGRQIDRGAKVVFDVAGSCGFGAMQAAQIRGVWGLGVDSDLSYLGPRILASAVKRIDRAIEAVIALAVDGKLPRGGNVKLNLANDAGGLVGISNQVPESTRRKLEAVAAKLRAQDQAQP